MKKLLTNLQDRLVQLDADNFSPSDLQFGQLAVQAGFITSQEVLDCLQEQKKLAKGNVRLPLGEIMLRKNLLRKEQFRKVFQAQGQRIARIGDYQILAKIGEGGMGSVYKAKQLSMDRFIALKILSKKCAEDEDFVKRFIREAQTAGQLNHANLVAAIDVGTAGNVYYFAMEYVEGMNLKAIIRERQKPFTEKNAIFIVTLVAKALEYACKFEIIHRDVKPENILIAPGNVVKLTDMGLAKYTGQRAKGDSEITEKNILIGTPSYMAPEQIDGSSIPDLRSDIYSLGATLYFLIAGRPPFVAPSAPGILAAHLTETPLPVNQRNNRLSKAITAIVDRMLQKRPEMRYQSYDKLIEDLERAADDKPIEAHMEMETSSSQRLKSVTARRGKRPRGSASRISRIRKRNARRTKP